MLIAWHELGHYAVARALGMRVLRFSIGFGPKLASRVVNGIEYQIAALPLGGYVQIKGMSAIEEGALDDPRSFVRRPRWARFLVMAAGPGFNYIMAAALFFASAYFWPSPLDQNVVELGNVVPASPALAAGLRPGDFVTHVDGVVPSDVNAFKSGIMAKQGAPVRFSVLRGSERFDVDITPQKLGDDYRIGVSPTLRTPSIGLMNAAATGVTMCGAESVRTLQALGALVRREPGVQMSSPVGIVAEMKEQVARGGRFFLYLLAVLSVNLGLFNLLPIPSLDGVKMLFLTVEGVVRKDLNASMQVWINFVGLVALLLLMAGLVVKDVWHMVS